MERMKESKDMSQLKVVENQKRKSFKPLQARSQGGSGDSIEPP